MNANETECHLNSLVQSSDEFHSAVLDNTVDNTQYSNIVLSLPVPYALGLPIIVVLRNSKEFLQLQQRSCHYCIDRLSLLLCYHSQATSHPVHLTNW
jgi:hypothetical protein